MVIMVISNNLKWNIVDPCVGKGNIIERIGESVEYGDTLILLYTIIIFGVDRAEKRVSQIRVQFIRIRVINHDYNII